jgi:hypothetical protein
MEQTRKDSFINIHKRRKYSSMGLENIVSEYKKVVVPKSHLNNKR